MRKEHLLNKQKRIKAICIAGGLALLTSVANPYNVVENVSGITTNINSVAHAKTISISSKTKSMTVGSKTTLKMKGTSKKVTWSSSNKKVATVSSKGVVKALTVGKATITAKVSGVKYTCKVTVKKLSTKKELASIHAAVKKAYGTDYLPRVEMSESQLKEIVSLKPSLYDAVIAEQPLMSAHVDTFIAVHPKAKNKEAVKKALTNYKKYLEESSLQYPMNIEKIKASKVVTVGDYVFFIMLGKMNDVEEDGTKLIKYYEKQNDIAINAIKKIVK